jgi:hypothetical protein
MSSPFRLSFFVIAAKESLFLSADLEKAHDL